MNIIKREFKANLKSLLIWCGVFILILAMASYEFDAFRDLANVDEILSAFPEQFRNAFMFDVVRFDQPEGYFSYMAQFFVVMVAIFGALSGSRILSKEIIKKTSETTFTLPITRRRLVLMKLLAAFINCVLLTAVIFLATFAIFSQFDVGAVFVQRLALLMLFWLIIETLFLSAGLFVSAISRRHKRVGAIMSGITVAFFMMSFIANMSDKYDVLSNFTPFDYFSAIDIMHGTELGLIGFIVVPVLIVGFFISSLMIIDKKDIL